MENRNWLGRIVIMFCLALGFFLVASAVSGTSDDEWKELEKSFKKEYLGELKTGMHRAAAVQKLAGVDHPGLVKLMVNSVIPNELKNNDPVVVDMVQLALGKLQNQEAVSALISESKKGSKENRVVLIGALGKINNNEATKQLIEYINDSDASIACAAIDALAGNKPAEATELIVKQLDSSKLPVVLSAIRYLGGVAEESQKETVLNALRARKEKEKKDERLKREISDAITRVSQTKPASDDSDGKSQTVAVFYGIPIHNPIFVVDISLSMTMPMTRIETLKKELKQAIEGLAKRDEVFDIIAFGDKTHQWKGQLVPAKQYQNEAFKWIDDLKCEGFTNIYDALELALQGQVQAGKLLMVYTGEKSKQEEICLLTDGSPNRGKYTHPEDIINAVAVLNKTRKLKIHCIGISIQGRKTDASGGMGSDHSAGGATPPPPDNRPGMLVSDFLKQLADKNNGVYIEK